jgi:hypothetical protein
VGVSFSTQCDELTTRSGKLLDRDYRIIKSKLSARKEDLAEKGTVSGVFPIEKARLRSTPIYLAIYVAAVVGYGWSLESRTSIAVPLILQFISTISSFLRDESRLTVHAVGYTIVALMNTAQTLLVDLLPGRGSSITAAVRPFPMNAKMYAGPKPATQNNLVRCSLGAGMVSVIDIIISSVGQGQQHNLFNIGLKLMCPCRLGIHYPWSALPCRWTTHIPRGAHGSEVESTKSREGRMKPPASLSSIVIRALVTLVLPPSMHP